MIKKIVLLITVMSVALPACALDFKYAPLVKTALDDLKKRTKLAGIRGHAAIHISSGNKELDKQFGEELQKAFPNLVSNADTVRSEDLYELTVKVYREGGEVCTALTLTDNTGRKLIDRTPRVKTVSPAVLETIQYKNALTAKNEFEAYLDSAFDNTSEVVQDARLIPKPVKPPPPPKEPFVMPAFSEIGLTYGLRVGLLGSNTEFGFGLGADAFCFTGVEGRLAKMPFRLIAIDDINVFYNFNGGGFSDPESRLGAALEAYVLGVEHPDSFKFFLVGVSGGLAGSGINPFDMKDSRLFIRGMIGGEYGFLRGLIEGTGRYSSRYIFDLKLYVDFSNRITFGIVFDYRIF